MKEAIRRIGELLKTEYGAESGAVGGNDFRSCVTNPERAKGFYSALVVVFPYYAGRSEGRVSLYARYADYHGVLKKALERAAELLPEGTVRKACADISPLNEVRAAALAGLGAIGRNGLLITREYGSFVFIGEILLGVELDFGPAAVRHCRECGKCVSACPTGALSGRGECLSSLTQKRRLNPEEEDKVRRWGSQWGCDVCQLVCPMNSNVKKTAIAEFTGEIMPAVTEFRTAGLDDKGICEKYAGRPFLWRGAKVVRRNAELFSAPGEPGPALEAEIPVKRDENGEERHCGAEPGKLGAESGGEQPEHSRAGHDGENAASREEHCAAADAGAGERGAEDEHRRI